MDQIDVDNQKKDYKWLIVGLVIMLIAFLGVGGYLYKKNRDNLSPTTDDAVSQNGASTDSTATENQDSSPKATSELDKIERDLTAVDADLAAANEETANVENGLNDQPIDLN